MSEAVTYYQDQDYNRIKSECLNSNSLFEDEYFPADDSSIARCQPINKRISWKRPHEIVSNPVFIDEYIEPNDLDQGQLGNCWFITGAVAVASVPEYIKNVIPEDQSFDNEYAGIFRFRFWRNGKWVEVVVDDRLPVDQNNRLIYCHNNVSKNEMFGPLLEKAYAKLNTCYEFLDCGLAVDAMIDMTGGVHESFAIRNGSKDKTIQSVDVNSLWEIIFKSFERRSLAGAFINASGGTSREQVQSNDLVLGHAYCVLEAFEILPNGNQYESLRRTASEPGSSKSIKLLRMRNPWGKEQSYKGSWEAGSSSWRKVSQQVQDEVYSHSQSDGQFLIAYSDFAAQFDEIDFVHVDFNAFYDSTNPTNISSIWTSQVIYGAWVAGKNAGGCGNDDFRNYWLNPQYYFKLPPSQKDDKVAIIAALLQCDQVKNRLKNNGSFSESNIPQAFNIYKIKDQNSQEKKYRENEVAEVGSTGVYVAKKEVSKRFELDPGAYIIIPSLFDKGAESNFVIRLFYETDSIADASSVEMHKLHTDREYHEQLVQEIERDAQLDAASEDQQQYQEQPEYANQNGYGDEQQHYGYGENQYEQNEPYQGDDQSGGDYGRGPGGRHGGGRGGRWRDGGGRRRRGRMVEVSPQAFNYEDVGRFASFLSHPMSVDDVKEQVMAFVMGGHNNNSNRNDYDQGRAIKGSRACAVM